MSLPDPPDGDRAFRAGSLYGMGRETAYAGAPSFLRRRYSRELAGVDLAVVGVPLDVATSHRPGARLGPAAVRQASAHLAWGPQWPWSDDPFERLAVVDWGDLVWDHGRPDEMPAAIEAQARAIGDAGPRLLALGGDHFATLPLLRALAGRLGRAVPVVHFDAHSDTWRDDPGPDGVVRIDHGTMMFHAVREGLVDPGRSVQVGIRTHNAEDFGFRVLDAVTLRRRGPAWVSDAIRETVAGQAAYLTFDIDCLDPSAAPGTGTPVVGGPSTGEIRDVLFGLAGLAWLGFDVVEVSPPFDHAQLTALAAASVAMDFVHLAAHEPSAR